MNYYSHHIGDFNNATRHLTRVERSIYRDMMDLYYDTELPLTLDVSALCRKLLARSEEESTAVQQMLNEFFNRTEQGWHHSRCESVIEEFRTNTSAKSAAGKASAAKREAERLEKLNASSTGVQQPLDGRTTDVQLPITHSPLPTTHIPTKDIDAEFAKAWTAYPKRPGASKADSLKAWKARIKAGATPEAILAGVVRYAAYVEAERTEPKYIKQPETFFGPGKHFEANWATKVHAGSQLGKAGQATARAAEQWLRESGDA
ncbi:MAG: putative phage protein [Massilia sp.]|nr:putative phage protein [Massilia sp.]